MKQINVGLLGCGTVGSGVARILIHNRELIQSRLGAVLNLKYVADSDPQAAKRIVGQGRVLFGRISGEVEDPDHRRRGNADRRPGNCPETDSAGHRKNGKQVVTANKARWPAGQRPVRGNHETREWILPMKPAWADACRSSRHCANLVGNRIHSMIGILNGTSNYIAQDHP